MQFTAQSSRQASQCCTGSKHQILPPLPRTGLVQSSHFVTPGLRLFVRQALGKLMRWPFGLIFLASTPFGKKQVLLCPLSISNFCNSRNTDASTHTFFGIGPSGPGNCFCRQPGGLRRWGRGRQRGWRGWRNAWDRYGHRRSGHAFRLHPRDDADPAGRKRHEVFCCDGGAGCIGHSQHHVAGNGICRGRRHADGSGRNCDELARHAERRSDCGDAGVAG